MKVPQLRTFTAQIAGSVGEIANYLAIDLAKNLREVANILNRLSLIDNFESFEFTGTITANTQLAIRNELRGGTKPTKRLVVRGDTYSSYVVDGDTAWTQDFVYLKNTHATQDATVTVIFLK